MKTAIVYLSKHGTTEKMALEISRKLNFNTIDLYDLKKKEREIVLSDYELIIIGGSIHSGNLSSRMKRFLKQNATELIKQKLALFVCSINEKEANKQFAKAYPEALRNHAVSNKVLGGEIILENMNFYKQLLVTKVARIKSNVSKIDQTKVNEFITEIKNS